MGFSPCFHTDTIFSRSNLQLSFDFIHGTLEPGEKRPWGELLGLVLEDKMAGDAQKARGP